MLYVPQRNQHLIRTTLPTSWGFIPAPDSPSTGASTMQTPGGEKSAFEALFEFVATSDDTPYLCVPAAIDFRQTVCGGEARIHEYMWQLANEAAEVFATTLGTDVIQEPDVTDWRDSMYRRCAMTTVRLPIPVCDGWENDPRTGFKAQGKKSLCEPLDASKVSGVCRWMQDKLVERDTFLPVFAHGGWLWTRLSAQVYLEKRDFEWAAGVVNELVAEVAKGL